jgi:hypothetical protein
MSGGLVFGGCCVLGWGLWVVGGCGWGLRSAAGGWWRSVEYHDITSETNINIKLAKFYPVVIGSSTDMICHPEKPLKANKSREHRLMMGDEGISCHLSYHPPSSCP